MGSRRNFYRAVVALALLVPVPSLGTAAALHWFPGPAGQTLYAIGKGWLLLFPLFWWLRVERGTIGLSPIRQGGLALGAVVGLVMAAAVIGAYWIGGRHLIGDPASMRAILADRGLGTVSAYLGLSVYIITVNSLLEECVWRWFVTRHCARLMPGFAAIFASAGFFTLHHVIALRAYMDWPATLLAGSGVFIAGAAWSWCYRRTGSIWPGYLSHAIADIAILAVGYHLLFG